MAIQVSASGIRGTVIPKLGALYDEMERIHGDLGKIIDEMNTNEYLKGKTGVSFGDEFYGTISGLFKDINTNLQGYYMQLESICAEFEEKDAEISSKTKVL